MASLRIRSALACMAVVFIASVSAIAWHELSRSVLVQIDTWENLGAARIQWINWALASNLEWSVKERALRAVETIHDTSSPGYMVGQLNYPGHWWRRMLDGDETECADIFRQSVAHSLALYGDQALGLLIDEIRRDGLWVHDDVVRAIGLIGTEAARSVLDRLAKDWRWRVRRRIVAEALKLAGT